MMPRLQRWMAALALSGLVLSGCSTTRHSKVSARVKPGGKGPASTPAKKTSSEGESSAGQDIESSIQGRAHYAAGLAYDLSNEPGKALEEYYQAALKDPGYEPVVLETARRYLRGKQPDRAIEVLKKAAAVPGAGGTPFAWLGLAYAQAGRTNDAINTTREAIQRTPHGLAAYQNLAQIYLQSGRTNDALGVIDDAARETSENAAFHLDVAELYFRFGRANPPYNDLARERARAALDRAAGLKPDNPALWQKLGEGYILLGDLQKAEEFYLDLSKSFPANPVVRAKLADIYLRTNQKDKAAAQLEAIAKEDPTNPQTHFFLGTLAQEQRQPAKAIEYFERALLLNPDLEPAYYELAVLKLGERKPREALELLEKARARFRLNFVLEFYSGMAQSAQKNYAEAIKHLISAELIARTGEPERLTPGFYFQLGAVYERFGDHKESEKHFRKCLELSPNFAEALNYLGYMWVENGTNLEEAKKLIEKAVDLEPKNAAFLDSLGWAYFKLNQPEEALKWLLKAVEHAEEPDATLYDHLGDIYAALQQFDRARQAWEKSLKVEPNDKVKAKLEPAPPAPTNSQP